MGHRNTLERLPRLQILADFGEDLRGSGRYEPATLRAYMVDLYLFVEQLAQKSELPFGVASTDGTPSTPPCSCGVLPAADEAVLTKKILAVTSAEIGAILVGQEVPKKVKVNTMRRRRSALRTFYSWAVGHELVRENPVKEPPVARQELAEVRLLESQEFQGLVDCDPARGISRLRNQAMLLLIWELGFKPGTLLAINVEDWLGSEILVRRGAVKKERTLSARARRALTCYLNSKSGSVDSKSALFTNCQGGRLSDRSFRRQFEDARKRAGLPPSLRLTDLRYSAIVRDLVNGMSPATVVALHGLPSVGLIWRRLVVSAEEQRARVERGGES